MSWGHLRFIDFHLTKIKLSIGITLLKLTIMGHTIAYNSINNSLAF